MIASGPQVGGILAAHDNSVEVVFVVCIDCGTRRSERAFDMTDQEAESVFKAQGWTITPTRCPECVEVHRAQEER